MLRLSKIKPSNESLHLSKIETLKRNARKPT